MISKGSDSILKKIWNLVVSIILFIELLMVFIIFIPSVFKIKTYVVTSGSMEPKLPIGSLVYSRVVSPNEIKKGDEITFYMSSDIIATHQVYDIDKENKLFYTQGINNKDENGKIIHDATPVKYENVIGKVILCVPYLGYVNRYVTTFPGIYVILGLTFIIVIMSYIIDKFSKKRKEVKNEK